MLKPSIAQAIIESSSNAVVTTDVKGRIEYANAAFLKQWGVSDIRQAVNRHISDFIKAQQPIIPDPNIQPEDDTHIIEAVAITHDGSCFQTKVTRQRIEDTANGNRHFLFTLINVTEHKKTEQAIRDSEFRYRALFENFFDAMFTMEKGRFIDCNLKTLEMFRCTAEQIIGKSPIDFSPQYQPDGQLSSAKSTDLIKQASSGVPQRFMWMHIRADGTPFEAEVSLDATEMDGRSYLQAIVRDISKTREMEAERARVNDILDATSDLVSAATVDGNLIYLNKAGYELLGLPPDSDIHSMKIADAHPKWANQIVREVGIPKAIENGTWRGETALLNKRTGREIPVSQVIIAHPSPDGSLDYLSTIMRDISDIKQAEENLKAALNEQQLIFNNASEGIILIQDDSFKKVNKRFSSILGFSEEEIINQPTRVLYSTDEEIQETITRAHQMLSSGEPWVRETRITRKDGRVIWCRLSGIAIDPRHPENGSIWVIEDIDEKKSIEDRLHFTQYSVDHAKDAFYWLDEDANIMSINNAACEALGYTSDELTSMNLTDIDPVFNFDLWRAAWERALITQLSVLETQHVRKDGTVFPVEIFANRVEYNGQSYMFSIARDITYRKIVEDERTALIEYLSALERVDRVIQQSDNLEQMHENVLKVVLEVFDSDRAFLLHPINNQQDHFVAPIECTRPDYPGARSIGGEFVIDSETARAIDSLNQSPNPICFGPGNEMELPESSRNFGAQSQLSMALRPKTGVNWIFGIHHCRETRTWSERERSLFKAIGHRLADWLNSLLTLENLRESEEHFRRLFDQSPDSLEIYSPEGNLVAVNRTRHHLLSSLDPEPGAQVNIFENQQFIRLGLMNMIREAFAGNDIDLGQYMLEPASVKHTGDKVYVHTQLYPLKDRKGKVKNVVVSHRDITAQKLVQIERANRRKRLEIQQNAMVQLATQDLPNAADFDSALNLITEKAAVVLNAARVGIWMLNDNGTELACLNEYMQPAGRHNSGNRVMVKDYPKYFASIQTGKTIATCEPSTDPRTTELYDKDLQRDRKQAILDAPILREGKVIGITCITAFAGRQFWKDDEAVFAGEISDQVLQALLLDEQRQSARARDQLLAELESKNTELERFTYTVSHDLKSPLVTIRGFLGLLEEDLANGETERVRDDIQRIDNAAQKMRQLLDELLELSRIGRFVNPPVEFSLSSVVNDVIELLATVINQSGATIRVADNLPLVYADQSRFIEVMQNLIDNAIKYSTNTGSPLIEIGAEYGTGEAVVYVADNGPGIAMEYQERIFGLFEKLEQGSAGTGIGLALVKRIIEHHRCRIWVESKGDGTGTIFKFTVPQKPDNTCRE